MKRIRILLLLLFAAPALSQAPSPAAAPVHKPAGDAITTQAEIIPDRTLKFTQVESDPSIALSPVTSVPQCDTGGSLFLDMLDVKDLNKHTVVSIHGKKSQTYLPSAISDLHDVIVFGFFPSESTVDFLVRGTKGMAGAPGPGKSPAGFAWSGYHNYIAEFNRDGGYKGSIELPMPYQLSHLAILPSGEFLVTGYDQLNSTARLLFLDSSGQVLRSLDMPALRTQAGKSAAYGSVEEARASTALIGSVVFTPYNQDILVWRRGSSDPIMDVGPGGRVREVPLQVPKGLVFVDMIPANDRWVAHFRKQSAAENSPFTEATYSYYELRPQDASLSSKLLISGDVPQFLACESDGNYITYKMDDANKMMLLTAR